MLFKSLLQLVKVEFFFQCKMLLSRRINELSSRLPPLHFTCHQKLSDSAVKLASKRIDNKNSNSSGKTQANPGQNKLFSPTRFNALYEHDSLNKNKWNSKTKPVYSGDRRWSQKTTKFNTNSTNWSSTEDESDYEDVAELKTPDWRKIPKINITKNCYTPSKRTRERTNECISNFCKENGIEIGPGVPKPIFEFNELNLSMELQQTIHDLNLTHCTPIQSYVIPSTLSGTNLVAVASDG